MEEFETLNISVFTFCAKFESAEKTSTMPLERNDKNIRKGGVGEDGV